MIESTSSNRRLGTPIDYGECPYCGMAFNANHRCINLELYIKAKNGFVVNKPDDKALKK